MRVLCFNAGSSALRVAGFEARGGEVREAFARRSLADEDWRAAIPQAFVPDVVAHRIVRGAKIGMAAEPYTQAVNAEIAANADLAPTHDPHALALLAQSQTAFPSANQIVVYDSAFHASIGPAQFTYAIPLEWRERGIRRVGYHGLSCAYAAEWLERNAGHPARAVHAHLGNGCSVTALRNGKSVATTMGYTPLEGAVMGTRCGSIDPGILLEMQRLGMAPDELRGALFRESGLRALCGTNDMREIERRRANGDPQAHLAFEVFLASACGAIAQMAAAAGGIDALTLAGGIGLHSQQVRNEITARLGWMLRDTKIFTLDVQEERMMALAALPARTPA
ncbi:MAG TPA: hypothetical protein VJP85_00515 [Candidatus Baltobacteraceae bacterium]|nr:hypothetical protein [Candidatus Baltobacteraceae bacterium]